jgi:alkanesulfonate monooxygenase SsuD/methylene tetrahydromethanopterin reductase-like flavin-dependent oxidoreductase (luciferase family)
VVRVGVIPAHGPRHLAEAIEHVRLAREYGFDSIWIEEHHDAGPYWPTPLLAIAALAPHLDSLDVGTSILVLPLHDPVHVAEQGAVLDQLTGGRFVLGVGLGDDPEEFAAFRVPAKVRGETLTFHGRFYEFKEVRLKTRAVQPGGPPIWIGGWSPKALRRAATMGDAWFPGPVGTFADIVERQHTYDTLLRERGEDPRSRPRPLIRDVLVAESDAAARELASETIFAAYRETYVESNHVLIGRQSSGGLIIDANDLATDRFIVGDATGVTEQLIECIAAIDCSRLVIRLKLPGLEPAQMTEMLHLLGRRVLPELPR